ncbi:MAG: hypothetical protein IKJ14_00310 [Clostridia bacterium]|nr:hypothetical protein [Clostridia bacterium]
MAKIKVSDFDKNFAVTGVKENDVVWYDAESAPFSLHGVYYDDENGVYRRMPKAVAETVNNGVLYGSTYGVGGRIRFITDSPYIAIKFSSPSENMLNRMPMFGSHGFGLYVDGKYTNSFCMEEKDVWKAKPNVMAFSSSLRYDEFFKEREIEIDFPLYNAVNKLFIGVKEGSKLLPPKKYKHEQPVIYYGSSITQGGCVSHAGNEYTAILSRMLDTDYINLGFSGSAKAEPTMIDYLASLSPSVFVLDYDHNSPNEEHLKSTYKPLFDGIRAKHPDTPIVMITSPNPEFMYHGKERKEIIYDVYKQAVACGDKNVYFIDGGTFFGEEDRDYCTVDLCHPNDLGSLYMAKGIYPVLNKILNK